MGHPHSLKLERVRSRMREKGIDVLLSFKPENSFYLSGFNPILYSHPVVAIVPLEGEPVLLLHALRDDHARSSSWVRDIRLYGAWSTKVTLGPHWQEALTRILGDLGHGAGQVGIEESFVSIQRLRELQHALPQAQFQDVSKLLDEARMIKTAPEIADARIAAGITEVGMLSAVEGLAAGGSERDICLASMAAMNRYWADNFPDVEVADFGSLEGGVLNGLWTWALTGDRQFLNTDVPTQRKPVSGELVSLLIWSNANGIHGENERTVAVGEVPASHRKAIDTILRVREDAGAWLRPGVPIPELFQAAKSSLERQGYGKCIPGRIGHGIGLGAHEALSLDARSPYTLTPGMLITFEPNLRIAGVCGTQISDTVLITDTGSEFLTTSHPGYLHVAAQAA